MRKAPPIYFGVSMILFASIFIFLGAHAIVRDLQYRSYGAKSTATIEHLASSYNGGKHGGTSYKAKYTFQAPSGPETVEVPISRTSYYYLHSGQQVPVLYLPGVRGESRLDDPVDEESQWDQHLGVLVFGLLFATFGGFMIRSNVRERRELR